MTSSLLRLNWSLFGYRHADETNAISKRQACCAHSESVSSIIFTFAHVEILQLTVNSQCTAVAGIDLEQKNCQTGLR